MLLCVTVSCVLLPHVLPHVLFDCAGQVTLHYGDHYSFNIPRQAEYLEFTSLHSVEQSILWNRTNPQTNKEGRVKIKWNVGMIGPIIPPDSGYYNFRKNDNALLSRTLLTVKENKRHYETQTNSKLFIQNPPGSSSWSVTFIPEGKTEKEHLTIEGNVVTEGEEVPKNFHGRIQLMNDGIEIDPVKNTDSGTFEFRDPDGNLAQTVLVEVEPENPYRILAVLIAAGMGFAVIVSCCRVTYRETCCSKRDSYHSLRSLRSQLAAVHLFLFNLTMEVPLRLKKLFFKEAPNKSYCDQLVNLPPATTSSRPLGRGGLEPIPATLGERRGPPGRVASLSQGDTETDKHSHSPQMGPQCQVHSPINVCVNPSQPRLQLWEPPVFELTGTGFPYILPLSSDPAVCDLYNSDKLDFRGKAP